MPIYFRRHLSSGPCQKGGRISPARLSDRSVARIIKRRVRDRLLQLGRGKAEAQELAARYVRAAEEWNESGLKGVGF